MDGRYVSFGPLVRLWIETRIVHTKGANAGKPFLLEPWQVDFIDELFLMDTETGLRVYSRAYLLLPRKNGKTMLAAALALFMLTEDRALNGAREASPEVYTAANSRNQARLVFDQAVSCARRSKDALGLRIQRNDVVNPVNDGVLRTISSEAANEHGLNPSAVIVDELHGAKNSDLLAAMQTATGARLQSLILVISSAGFNMDGPLYSLIEKAQEMPGFEQNGSLGTVKDRENGFLYWRWGAPEEADAADPHVWRDANPASWLDMADLQKLFNAPDVSIEDFNRFHLNRFVVGSDSFLGQGVWNALKDKSSKIERGSDVWVGVDLAASYDTSAIAVVSRIEGEGLPRFRVEAHVFSPDEADEEMIYRVERKLRDIAKTFNVREVAYDPWRFQKSALDLASEGLPMVEFGQSDVRMCPATQVFFQAVKDGRLVHNGDRVLAAHVAHGKKKETQRGFRVDKSKAKDKIDALVALIIALARADAAASKKKRKVRIELV